MAVPIVQRYADKRRAKPVRFIGWFARFVVEAADQ
jgi:hypothetical protein